MDEPYQESAGYSIRSEVAAYGWLAGASTLPILAGAILIGPSAGQFYAGSSGLAFAGIGLRLQNKNAILALVRGREAFGRERRYLYLFCPCSTVRKWGNFKRCLQNLSSK